MVGGRALWPGKQSFVFRQTVSTMPAPPPPLVALGRSGVPCVHPHWFLEVLSAERQLCDTVGMQISTAQAESGNVPQSREFDSRTSTNRTDESRGHPLSLLSLLDTISCPTRTSRFLVKTDIEWEHLKALASLWQSLGRPTSVFWRETVVYPQVILDSYSGPDT
jgi:hypothetical protein